MRDDRLMQNKQSWDTMADGWFGTTALPVYGCLAPTEEELRLFPDLKGKSVLDIGCGSGHSLQWCAENGAAEIWGLDMSTRQIENARRHLTSCGIPSKLVNAPMEADSGIPEGHFDVVYSIYALGWTTDLRVTVGRIASYLKPGGVFIFSWDHPIMRCVEGEGGRLVFTGSYLKEDWFSYRQRGNPVTMKKRKMSTYINALAEAGLMTERLVEETDAAVMSREVPFSPDYYAPFRAQNIPLSFILKARKL